MENAKYFITAQLFLLPLWQVHSSTENPLHLPLISHVHRRQKGQQIADQDREKFQDPGGKIGPDKDKDQEELGRFSTWATTTKKKLTRTTPTGITLAENCDYIVHSCLHQHQTGKLCARTIVFEYSPFDNYCIMEYVNCLEGHEVWQVVHMGACFQLHVISDYMHFVYQDDWFMDDYYVLEDTGIGFGKG